jgi:hypothetical protein
MNSIDKIIEIINRIIMVVLFVILLIIFYQYTENGRYSYHKGRHSQIEILDPRTGIIYGNEVTDEKKINFYRIDMKKGQVWIKTTKYMTPPLKLVPYKAEPK